MISAEQVEIYMRFNGDVDMYQRRGSPGAIGDAWDEIEDLRRRMFLVAMKRASARFASQTQSDLLAWTNDEDARRLINDIVKKDANAQSSF